MIEVIQPLTLYLDEDTMKKLCRLCRNEKYKGKKVAETEWVMCMVFWSMEEQTC